MKPITPFGLPIGISAAFWLLIGITRFLTERFSWRKRRGKPHKKNKFRLQDIAVLLPAHNEELVIRKSIRALKNLVHAKQIYVVSDGSLDKTYRRARMEGSHVSRLIPGQGKAKALLYLLRHYRLFERYQLIFIVDADTQIDQNFLKHALPYFNDPKIGVVFGRPGIHWPDHIIPKLSYYYIAYRERLNIILRLFYIYGQTWKYTNVNYVIPGFATIYRSNVLRKLEIDTPGLLIEDFNLAFQLHRKHLGKIGHDPSIIGWDQHPDNLTDYWKQVKRWNIGFFQTVRKNGVWPSFFWLALGVFSIEVLLNSIFILFLPFLIFYLILPTLQFSHPLLGIFAQTYHQIGPYQYLNLKYIFLTIVIYDYLLSVIIGFTYKRPQFALYGLFFFFMHYVTSLILVSSLIPGFFGSSTGRWISPKRHTLLDSPRNN